MAGASCTSKCHGGRGSTKANCCNTPNLDDDQLLTPGAFATTHSGASANGAIPTSSRKQQLHEQVNNLQGGLLFNVWVVATDDLNCGSGPEGWVLGKVTHEDGHHKPFLVNYNDGTEERYTSAKLSETEGGSLRHEIEIGYICPTREPTALDWGNAAFGPAPEDVTTSQRTKAP